MVEVAISEEVVHVARDRQSAWSWTCAHMPFLPQLSFATNMSWILLASVRVSKLKTSRIHNPPNFGTFGGSRISDENHFAVSERLEMIVRIGCFD
jgi:hypothetical protein